MALTHIDDKGKARMVDVTDKGVTDRVAVAKGAVRMKQETLDLILANEVKKGDVLAVARLAGIMAAKKTGEIIPLCHPLNLTSVEVEFATRNDLPGVEITATTKVSGKTGVEMEALTAVATAALTVYDMCKAVDKEMELTAIRLVKKTGGRSGEFVRP
ncbi:MAG: cyclic pyranopterin monophosphate synthase MoaC [Deltaproteobacteria bacterium]|nr:cyclic pyranopterin monophosphate synthase MoaC [Deltaproteobacteria bacterium]